MFAFLNIGTWELVIIALVALLVVGPDKLPDMARKASTLLGDLRDTVNDYKQEFQGAVKVDEFEELKHSTQDLQNDLRSIMNPLATTSAPKRPEPTQREKLLANSPHVKIQEEPEGEQSAEVPLENAGHEPENDAPVSPTGATSEDGGGAAAPV